MRPLLGADPRMGGLSPSASSLRRCQRVPRISRDPRGLDAQCKAQNHESDSHKRILRHARQVLLAAAMSLAAAIGSPLEAEAKKAEPPPPPPTAYDVRSSYSLPPKLTLYCTTMQSALHAVHMTLLPCMQELQKIISGRSGNTGSLLENFKKTVTAPVSGKTLYSTRTLFDHSCSAKPDSHLGFPMQAWAFPKDTDSLFVWQALWRPCSLAFRLRLS